MSLPMSLGNYNHKTRETLSRVVFGRFIKYVQREFFSTGATPACRCKELLCKDGDSITDSAVKTLICNVGEYDQMNTKYKVEY